MRKQGSIKHLIKMVRIGPKTEKHKEFCSLIGKALKPLRIGFGSRIKKSNGDQNLILFFTKSEISGRQQKYLEDIIDGYRNLMFP